MDEPILLIVELDSDVQHALQTIEVDLLQALRGEGLHVEAAVAPPGILAQQGTKGTELMILSVAAGSPFVAVALERVIRAVTNRPVRVTNRRWSAARTAAGEIQRDKKGAPVMECTEETQIVAPSGTATPVAKGQFSFLGLKFSFGQS